MEKTPSPVYERIKRRLVEVGMSAEAASKKAGMGRDGIRNIKRGKSHSLTGENLVKLAAVLQCAPEDLVPEWTPPEVASVPLSATPQNRPPNEYERRALAVLRSLYIDEIEQWLAMGERLSAAHGGARPFPGTTSSPSRSGR